MKTITLYNKGKRNWIVKNSAGADIEFVPNTSIEIEEVAGLRLLTDYPRDFTSSKISAPSTEDLARREQSIKDKEAHLKEREKALDEREKALNEREGVAAESEKPKRGRPAKAKDETEAETVEPETKAE